MTASTSRNRRAGFTPLRHKQVKALPVAARLVPVRWLSLRSGRSFESKSIPDPSVVNGRSVVGPGAYSVTFHPPMGLIR